MLGQRRRRWPNIKRTHAQLTRQGYTRDCTSSVSAKGPRWAFWRSFICRWEARTILTCANFVECMHVAQCRRLTRMCLLQMRWTSGHLSTEQNEANHPRTTGLHVHAARLQCHLNWSPLWWLRGGGPRVVVSTAAFHARVRGSVPGLGGLKETKLFLPHPRVKVSIVGSLRDREVACSASDRQGSNFESCVWRTVSSQSSHHPQEVLLAQFSLYVHKGGLKPDSFHFDGYEAYCAGLFYIVL